jgi:hypothetical protein
MERLACGKPSPGANWGLRAVDDRIVGRPLPMDRMINDWIMARPLTVHRNTIVISVSTRRVVAHEQQVNRKHGEERRRRLDGHYKPPIAARFGGAHAANARIRLYASMRAKAIHHQVGNRPS